MLKNEREREIINLLKVNNGFLTVKELCKSLYASESSIRRDLCALEGRGVIRRPHGGAELVAVYSNAIAFNSRAHHNIAAKKIIAKKAASLIKDGDVIFLDQSSSAFYLASEIVERSSITVITNNIEIVSLMSNSGIKTICSGGMLGVKNRTCLIGADASAIFESVYADAVFFSTKSISDDGVISDCDREEVLVRGTMLKNAKKRVYLCDSEKVGEISAYKQCAVSDVDCIVSENDRVMKYRALNEDLEIL